VNYRSRSLGAHHDIETFDCRVEALNSWLCTAARRAQKADTARTYVWTTAEDPARVVAYFSIAPTMVAREELSQSQAGGYSFPIPAYLLARLALDQSLHGKGLGGELLVDAVGRMVGAAEAYGGRLIVVDAIDENAATFYRRHDFVPVKGNPHRLVLKIATARKAMGVL
jgi:GNAT superfamily N-acetyltransferase